MNSTGNTGYNSAVGVNLSALSAATPASEVENLVMAIHSSLIDLENNRAVLYHHLNKIERSGGVSSSSGEVKDVKTPETLVEKLSHLRNRFQEENCKISGYLAELNRLV